MSISLTGQQNGTTLADDHENALILKKLEQLVKAPGHAQDKKRMVAALFLQRATCWFTIFVDSDQQQTLSDIVFWAYLHFVIQERPLTPPLSTSARVARCRARELCQQLLLPQLHSHPWYRGQGLRQDTHTVAQLDQAAYTLAAYLSWYPRLRFGRPSPWSFDLLTPEQQNVYTTEEQEQERQRQAGDKDYIDEEDVVSLWYPRRHNDWSREDRKEQTSELPGSLKTSLRESWRILLPLQSLWLTVYKRKEVRDAHVWQDIPYWTSGHRTLLPSLWVWVNMHPGHMRTTEARNLYFTRLLPPGRRDQLLRFVNGNYSRLSPANMLRMCAPLAGFMAAESYSSTHLQVLFGLRLPKPEPGAEAGAREKDQDKFRSGNRSVLGKRKAAARDRSGEEEEEEEEDLITGEEDPGVMKRLWQRRVAQLTPLSQWNDLHVAWLVTQFDNFLEGETGIRFRDQFLLMDCELLQHPFKVTEYGENATRHHLRAPLIIELADQQEWGVSVVHKQFTSHADGTRTYCERPQGKPVLHRCRNLMDALQCWINAVSEPPYSFAVRQANGVAVDLRSALEPLVAHHNVGQALHALAGLTSFPS